MKSSYLVRPGMVLHKMSVVKGRMTTQLFQAGDEIELTEKEAIAYKHLIETNEQASSRSKTTSKSKASK